MNFFQGVFNYVLGVDIAKVYETYILGDTVTQLYIPLEISKKIDFIYERYSFLGGASSKVAQKKGIPIILEVNEISGLKRQRQQAMVGFCGKVEREIFLRVDAIIVISQYLKDKIVERGISAEKIYVISNAVNIQDFDIKTDISDIEDQYGKNEKIKLMFVGMFSHWDKLEFLLEVFKNVHSKRANAHLIIVGDGVQRTRLQEQAQALGISGHVTFTGEVNKNDIPKFILLADICLLSDSNPFGSPMTLFEYMALGKPVVVPRYGPIECIVKHENEGCLFEPGNATQFEQCLIDLIDDEKKRKDYGTRGREKIIKYYLWEHNAEKVIEIYRNIGKGRKL